MLSEESIPFLLSVGLERTGAENLSGDFPEFPDIRGFAQCFPQFVAALKPAVEEPPVFLHPEHGISCTAEFHLIHFQQFPQEAFQGFLFGAAAKHAGIGDKTPADHDGLHLGILATDFLCLGPGQNIAVVAQGIAAVFYGIIKHLHIHAAGVELLPYPGMDGQFLDGIFVIQFQNGRKFFGIPNPQTADGPAGVRLAVATSCFPCENLLSCSWDRELLELMGSIMGKEALNNNIDNMLAPGMNIHRDPLCGRNFE